MKINGIGVGAVRRATRGKGLRSTLSAGAERIQALPERSPGDLSVAPTAVGAGAGALPSGTFLPNGAWTVIAGLPTTCCAGVSVLGLPGQTVRGAAPCADGCSPCPAG